MKYLLFLLPVTIFFACSSKKTAEISRIPAPDVRTLKLNILKGDTSAYMALYNLYYQNDNAVDFFPWAVIMANKFKYKRAYTDAFGCLSAVNNYYGESDSGGRKSNLLDSATMDLAKELLYKNSDTTQINRELRSFYDMYDK